MGEGSEEKKEKPEKGIVKRLRKLTSTIEKAIIERIMTNPDSLAVDKDFEKIDKRLVGEAGILSKRYKIEDEIDEKGNIEKAGYEKILETIGYDYDERKEYKGVRKGDLMNYERNALFRMWHLPVKENDIKQFENRINIEVERLSASKKFKGISKEEILKAIHFDEIESYKGVTKEDLLFWEGGFVSAINNLKIDKNGEIKTSGVGFLESPKSEWAKKAFAFGVPTLLLFSLYPNAPSFGKEKPVSLKELEENPDLLNEVYKEVIFNLIAPNRYAVVMPNTTSELTGEVYGSIAINLKYSDDNPYLDIAVWTPPEYFEEMNKIGLHIDDKNSYIPLSFYLEHRDEVDKIIVKYRNISPEEMKKIDTLIKITEVTEKIKDVPILSWDNFSVGEDVPENVKKINDFRELLKEGKTGAVPSYDSNFTDAIDGLLQKEGYDDAKLKKIAERNPKEVIGIIAGIIDKNVEYDNERAKAIAETLRGEPLSEYEGSLTGDRTPTETLKKGGVCEDISDVVTATVEYVQSKEILPQNLLVSRSISRFMDHSFNPLYTVYSIQ